MRIPIELDREITNITMKIQKEYPELLKYMGEMPVTISEKSTDVVNSTNMEDYYNSLVKLIAEYSRTHASNEVPAITNKEIDFLGYPYYPTSDDIYIQGKKEIELNPENISKKKVLK